MTVVRLALSSFVAVLFVTSAAEGSASACGVSTGAGGGVSSCSLDAHEREKEGPPSVPWRVGAAYTYTSTALRFTGDQRVDMERKAFVLTLEYRVTRRLSLLAGAGALAGGQIVSQGTTFDLQTGPLVALGASYRILDPAQSGQPFLVFGGQLSYVASGTRRESSSDGATGYYAGDLRLGMTFGVTLFDRVSPFATARVFGGPAYWRIQGQPVQGTDIHKYQVGGGLVLALGGKKGPHIDAILEGIPLGEQGLTGGFGLSF